MAKTSRIVYLLSVRAQTGSAFAYHTSEQCSVDLGYMLECRRSCRHLSDFSSAENVTGLTQRPDTEGIPVRWEAPMIGPIKPTAMSRCSSICSAYHFLELLDLRSAAIGMCKVYGLILGVDYILLELSNELMQRCLSALYLLDRSLCAVYI